MQEDLDEVVGFELSRAADAIDPDTMTDEQVDAELKRRGIDVTGAFRKVLKAIGREP
jgi:hypothetical protein